MRTLLVCWLLHIVVGSQSQHVPLEAQQLKSQQEAVKPEPLDVETTTGQAANCEAKPSVLVVGATGATGRHVVQQLLDHDYKVSVIVRSKQRMLNALDDSRTTKEDLLTVTEIPTSIVDLTDDQILELVEKVDVIVSCLGHASITAEPRRLVTDTVRRFSTAAVAASTSKPNKKKLILMTSDGCVHPNDTPRPWYEQGILYLIRQLVPPHADNEDASAYLLNRQYEIKQQQQSAEQQPESDSIEWIVVRPTMLIDDTVSTYHIEDQPSVLFGPPKVARKNVAKFMVDLIESEELWSKYKFRMPVVHDADYQGKSR